MKGIIKKIIIIPITRMISMLPNFVAMYKIPTKMLKIIEEVMKIASINFPKVIDFDLLIIS